MAVPFEGVQHFLLGYIALDVYQRKCDHPGRFGFVQLLVLSEYDLMLDEQEMRMIADIAKENDLYLICDEVYREFCYDDKYGVPCMGRFDDLDDHLVIIDSVSKRFSACGARVGCVITKNKELQQAVLKFCQSRLAVATLDQIGAAALYSVDEEFFKRSKEEYRRRRDLVVDRLRKMPGVAVTEPMGAFYVMASLPVDNADKFQRWQTP